MADQEQAVVHSLENRNLRRRIQFFQMLRPRFGHKGRKPLTAGIELQAVEAVPFAAGEVGHDDRHGAVGDGDLREFHERTPLRRVIDVFVERQAVVEAVDQAVVHDEIHPAVATDLTGEHLYLPGNGVFERSEEGIPLRVAHILLGSEVVRREDLRGIAPEGETPGGVFVGIPLRPDNLVHPVVGTRSHDVVLDEDGLALVGTDHRRSKVAVCIFHGTLDVAGLVGVFDS